MSLICVDDFERKAHEVIDKNALDYFNSGAGEEFSLNLNREAFRRLRIRPRCLRDVTNVNTICKIFGNELKFPVGISPTAMQKLAHPEGEIANARAAGNIGSIYIMATVSTTTIEDVAAAAPNTTKWFQLYIYKDRTVSEKLLHRAEKAGFKAIVLTVDTPIFGIRRAVIRNKFRLPSHIHLANFVGVRTEGLGGDANMDPYKTEDFDRSLTWQDVEWLIKKTNLPVIVKGVLTREDAILAREFGCAGIIVSNHGARQVDTVPASIEALPEIVSAVGQDLTVMLDGGIRQGIDIFKAFALGAKYVFIGRPALWGLGCNGQAGVEDVFKVLQNELETTLALTGCSQLNEISKEMVVHESYYTKL